MSNQLPGCDKCYANSLILQGDNLQIIRVNRMLQIIGYPNIADEGEIESMCMNMNFCPDCGHDYNSDGGRVSETTTKKNNQKSK